MKVRQIPLPDAPERPRARWVDLAAEVLKAYEKERALEIDAADLDVHAMRSAVGQQLTRRGLKLRTQRRGNAFVLWAVKNRDKNAAGSRA